MKACKLHIALLFQWKIIGAINQCLYENKYHISLVERLYFFGIHGFVLLPEPMNFNLRYGISGNRRIFFFFNNEYITFEEITDFLCTIFDEFKNCAINCETLSSFKKRKSSIQVHSSKIYTKCGYFAFYFIFKFKSSFFNFSI